MNPHIVRSFIALTVAFLAGSALVPFHSHAQTVIFEDAFGSESRGELKPNTITEAPPAGMGYTTEVPAGFALKHWIIADVEADGPRRSFWVIPQRANGEVDGFAEQAGRSRNSIAYAGKPIPNKATHYVVEFKQRANDNDYIGFVLGAQKPVITHDGVEIGYMRQIPGTDDTVDDIYYRGPFGRGRIDGKAKRRRWVEHRFEVRGQHVSWSQDGEVLLAGSVSTLRPGGWFGIRQSYERGTRYDDVKITVLAEDAAADAPAVPLKHHLATVEDAVWNAHQDKPTLPDGWTCFGLLPGNTLSAARLKWWTPLATESPAQLRFAIAADDDEQRTIEVTFGESGRSAGSIKVANAKAFQPFSLQLDGEAARRAVDEGLRLTLLDGSKPLWILWQHQDADTPKWELLPQLLQERQQDSNPTPGTTGNAANVPHIGGRDPGGNPVRLARQTGHVSNYDESKVKPYTLPDPLKMADGRAVDSAEQWHKERREEILAFYESQIYGRIPDNAPEVHWEAQADGEQGEKRILGRIGSKPGGPKIGLDLHLPEGAEGPVPVLLHLSFFTSEAARERFLQRTNRNHLSFDQRAAVLKHGWAFAQIGYGDIQPDRADHWHEGVIGQTLAENQERPAEGEWGTISAWAWGASRVIDYLETLEAIDRKRIALTGTSRLGKTSLWAAANDSRIAAVFSAVPGEMGASLIRRDWGETLDDMAQNFPWQFAGNLQNWVGKWDALPVDQHMLIALIAPRAVYVNGGLSDQWSDPKGEFLAMAAAGPVYRLLGAGDLGTETVPELDQPIISQSLAFHYHSQGHHAVPEDWRLFLEFADNHFAATAKPKGE